MERVGLLLSVKNGGGRDGRRLLIVLVVLVSWEVRGIETGERVSVSVRVGGGRKCDGMAVRVPLVLVIARRTAVRVP